MGDVVRLINNNKEQEEETMGDIEYLRTVTGGKEPPQDGNWLSQLEKGSIFLAEPKRNPQDFTLGEFILMDKTERSVLVASPTTPGQRLWWNPVRFCGQYALREVLGVLGESSQEEENDSDERDRSTDTDKQT
jgi:hypothetical protein